MSLSWVYLYTLRATYDLCQWRHVLVHLTFHLMEHPGEVVEPLALPVYFSLAILGL